MSARLTDDALAPLVREISAIHERNNFATRKQRSPADNARLDALHAALLAAPPAASPPRNLAAENAALREALAASGELLAEAHAEIARLRGAK